MNFRHVAAFVAGLALVGCSGDKSDSDTEPFLPRELARQPIHHQLVDSLVDSFDAPSCLDARLRYAGRVNVGESVFHQRRFDAPDKCLSELQSAAAHLGFAEGKAGGLSGDVIDGTFERLRFGEDAGIGPGNLVWEVDVT
ncbi:hypothetical protein [Altererythrobacter lutimaris]|uniref:Lipoprotein n=1 Tax=Altererythrobacter lutimaris TaxID=2743979 RepID=A0A850H7H0_9SPHN|nr:hypothetical protein [Altererythrobacter lutimaris]NVE93709.1 hypothetical protein [Altererythrobacter lutimaris]